MKASGECPDFEAKTLTHAVIVTHSLMYTSTLTKQVYMYVLLSLFSKSVSNILQQLLHCYTSSGYCCIRVR